MKYIDADRLKAEIEKHIKEVKDAAKRFTPNMGFFDAKLSGIYDVIAIIDSLQQEQQEVDLEKDVESWFFNEISSKINVEHTMYYYFQECARRYFELGKNSK